ncbi:MAG: 50S ribosomal protein L17 [Eubacteriales bacterium]
MAINKLNRPSDERKALLRGLVTSLIWNGRIETTQARAKEVRSIAEKIITKAIKEYGNTIKVTKLVDKTETEFVNDAPSKLATRRLIMEYLYDFPVKKNDKESKYEFRQRTADNQHPVIEKLFREVAPKYDKRAKELGQGGGYTRILKKGPRRGDAAEMVILELV